jgi:hypothetical protein
LAANPVSLIRSATIGEIFTVIFTAATSKFSTIYTHIYQWQRRTGNGTGCGKILCAILSTYTTVAADSDEYI